MADSEPVLESYQNVSLSFKVTLSVSVSLLFLYCLCQYLSQHLFSDLNLSQYLFMSHLSISLRIRLMSLFLTRYQTVWVSLSSRLNIRFSSRHSSRHMAFVVPTFCLSIWSTVTTVSLQWHYQTVSVWVSLSIKLSVGFRFSIGLCLIRVVSLSDYGQKTMTSVSEFVWLSLSDRLRLNYGSLNITQNQTRYLSLLGIRLSLSIRVSLIVSNSFSDSD